MMQYPDAWLLSKATQQLSVWASADRREREKMPVTRNGEDLGPGTTNELTL
jgi:hypothetical protein